ncbi:MAG TPA: hypothetical protein VEZ20_16625 [Allosphingosinicella sp.]|nr:hypothetical protein [Allosphingosinicella sp.]
MPLLLMIGSLMLSARAEAQQCALGAGFSQPDENGARSVRVLEGDGALFFGTGLNVNTDGTRRSYNVSDFWGERTALNNLCNAMRDACRGLTSGQMRERRLLTQRARAQGWPSDLLAATRISPDIIPFRGGRPCPEVGGFLVSATALARPNAADPCDLANYVDALEVAALVLPKRANASVPTEFQRRGAQIGDVAAVTSADGRRVVFAVVGDLGPARELGEGSVALNGALLGRAAPPASYQEVRGRGPYAGRGWTVPMAYVLVFPGTRDTRSPFLTRERVEEAGRLAFERWGGQARLASCRASYRPD